MVSWTLYAAAAVYAAPVIAVSLYNFWQSPADDPGLRRRRRRFLTAGYFMILGLAVLWLERLGFFQGDYRIQMIVAGIFILTAEVLLLSFIDEALEMSKRREEA